VKWVLKNQKENFVVLGTSNVQEKHAPQYVQRGYYVNPKKDKRWPEVFSDKLGYTNHTNCGVNGMGISTYYPRLLSIVNELNPNFLLIEIPCQGRWEISFDNNQYNSGDIYTNDHWKNLIYQTHLYLYNNGDIGIDPKNTDKFQKLDNKQIPASVLKDAISLQLYYNQTYYDDLIFSQVIIISEYLKNKKIPFAWFNYNFGIDVDMFRKYNIECINRIINYQKLEDYVIENYSPDPDVGFCADGGHLNSKYWRMLVDDVFIPYFKNRK